MCCLLCLCYHHWGFVLQCVMLCHIVVQVIHQPRLKQCQPDTASTELRAGVRPRLNQCQDFSFFWDSVRSGNPKPKPWTEPRIITGWTSGERDLKFISLQRVHTQGETEWCDPLCSCMNILTCVFVLTGHDEQFISSIKPFPISWIESAPVVLSAGHVCASHAEDPSADPYQISIRSLSDPWPMPDLYQTPVRSPIFLLLRRVLLNYCVVMTCRRRERIV